MRWTWHTHEIAVIQGEIQTVRARVFEREGAIDINSQYAMRCAAILDSLDVLGDTYNQMIDAAHDEALKEDYLRDVSAPLVESVR